VFTTGSFTWQHIGQTSRQQQAMVADKTLFQEELDVAINFVSSTKNMLHLSFYLVKAIHKRY